MEKRNLEISDLAVAQEAEIIKNPYRFLGLAEGANLREVRKSYIRLANKYHPDLIHPQFKFEELPQLYSDDDVKAANLSYSIHSMIKIWKGKKKDEDITKILEGIRIMAHNKMVILNRAYEEIKSRFSPKELEQICGYEFENFGDYYTSVKLEGRGNLTIFLDHSEYWVKGPYLEFSYGHQDWDPGDDHYGFRRKINLRHMFAHIEREENQSINRVLLEPLIECFSLDDKQSKDLLDYLSLQETTESIMQKMGIPILDNIDPIKNHDAWFYSLQFSRHLNQIITLTTDTSDYPISLSIENGKLTLEENTEEETIQTNFSETDYILFLTLAYGNLLR